MLVISDPTLDQEYLPNSKAHFKYSETCARRVGSENSIACSNWVLERGIFNAGRDGEQRRAEPNRDRGFDGEGCHTTNEWHVDGALGPEIVPGLTNGKLRLRRPPGERSGDGVR